jgi:hypothetical protein
MVSVRQHPVSRLTALNNSCISRRDTGVANWQCIKEFFYEDGDVVSPNAGRGAVDVIVNGRVVGGE